LVYEVPWQQIADAADRVVSDSSEHGAEVELRVEAVELG